MSLSTLADQDTARYVRRRTGVRPELDDRGASTLADATSVIVAHIPTEVVTVYVVLTGLSGDPGGRVAGGQWALFWVVLALTPVVSWLLYAVRVRRAGGEVPLAPATWPWASLVLGTIAFAIWAFSLPGTPFATFGWYRPVLGAGTLLIGSPLIGLIGQLVRRPQ